MKDIDDIFDFILYEKGTDIIYNGTSKRVLITDSNSIINYEDDKQIYTDFPIKTGDLIVYQNNNWLVTSQINKHKITYRGRITKAEQSFKLNINSKTYIFTVIFTSSVQAVSTDKYLTLVSGKILAKVQDNSDALNLALNLRFIKMGSAWKITGIDKSKLGLIVLTCDVDLFQTNDDKVNEVAYNAPTIVTPPSNLAISGATSIKISTSSNYTIANNTNSNTFTWSLVDAITLGATTYGSITSSTTTTCTVKANSTGGKQMKLLATSIEVPTTILTIILTSSSGF